MFLSNRQRQQIEQIIERQHEAFTAEVLGSDFVLSDDRKDLSHKSLSTDLMAAAHTLGALSIEDTVDPSSFWRMQSERYIQPVDKDAVVYAKDKLAQYLKSLSATLKSQVQHAVAEANNGMRRGKQKDNVDALVKSVVRKAMDGARKQWMQIASTEVHNAVEEGKALAIAKSMGKQEALVFKRPKPDACPFCTMFYMNKGIPRVYRLEDLQANGSNVGRKAKRPIMKGMHATEWKPVVGSVHPWCRCELHHLPPGFGFNTTGNVVHVGMRKSMALVEPVDAVLYGHACVK